MRSIVPSPILPLISSLPPLTSPLAVIVAGLPSEVPSPLSSRLL